MGQATVPADITPGNLVQLKRSSLAEHNCALLNNDTIRCWGQTSDAVNDWGTPPAGLSNIAQLAAGSTHTCALKKDDSIVCWG